MPIQPSMLCKSADQIEKSTFGGFNGLTTCCNILGFTQFFDRQVFSPERKSYDVYNFINLAQLKTKNVGRITCLDENFARKKLKKDSQFPICDQCLISKAFPSHATPKSHKVTPTQPKRNPQRNKFKKSHVNQIGKENVAQINFHIDCKIGCVAIVTLVSLIWKTTRLD